MSSHPPKSQIVTEIATVAIAVIALVVSIWSGIESRQHNRLSVRPALNFDIEQWLDGTINTIYIKNFGTGPAIVKKFTVYVDDQPAQEAGAKMWDSALNLLGLSGTPVEIYWYDPEDVIGINEATTILKINLADYARLKDRQTWQQAMSRIKITLEYRSIYDEAFTVKY